MPIILGIDPGSRQTGYGFIRVQPRKEPVHIHSGVVRTQAKSFSGRLSEIFKMINDLVKQFQPKEVAVEEVFFSKNAQSALKLGQARGAAIVAATQYDLPLFEYSARQVKQAIVGYGAAQKHQMQLMVRHHLGLQFLPQSDQADALAVALCHHRVRSSALEPCKLLKAGMAKPQGNSTSDAEKFYDVPRRRSTSLKKWAEKRFEAQKSDAGKLNLD